MGGTSGQEADGPEDEFRRTKSRYWRDRMQSEQSNPHQLWKSLGILTGDKCAKIDSGHSAEEFVSFFEETSRQDSTVNKFGSTFF